MEHENQKQANEMVKTLNTSHPTTAAMISRNRSFLGKLFPDKLDTVLYNSELRQARTETEFREKALKIVKSAQLHSIREMYNQYLIKGKGDMRRDRTRFFAEQYEELEREINHITTAFYTEIEHQYRAMEKLSLPFLREKEEARIIAGVDRYHEAVNKLMSDFNNILFEDIRGELT